VTTFYGVVAPAGTPETIVARLNAAINDALGSPAMQESLRIIGAVAAPGTPQEFSAFIAAEARKWSAAARAANVHVD
jgi:tripartite-type tricarboxylate transporter receptor subunit TctC